MFSKTRQPRFCESKGIQSLGSSTKSVNQDLLSSLRCQGVCAKYDLLGILVTAPSNLWCNIKVRRTSQSTTYSCLILTTSCQSHPATALAGALTFLGALVRLRAGAHFDLMARFLHDKPQPLQQRVREKQHELKCEV